MNIENNKLIAEFMGIKVLEGFNNGHKYYYYNSPEFKSYEALPDYHFSWNELMEVIDKINKLSDDIEDYDFEPIFIYLCDINIQDTYILVVDFIKWYNTQKYEVTN